jgi:uncharacterized membrane protein
MNKKPKLSLSKVIRRFFSIFLLFSIVSGIINDILSGTFSGDSIGGAVGGLVIVFFLSGIGRRSKTPTSDDGSKETVEEDKDIYDEETLQEFEKYDSEEVVVKESETTNKTYNPIKDKDSFLVRIFRGRVDRI